MITGSDQTQTKLTNIFPVVRMGTELGLVFILIMLFSIIGVLFTGYILGPLFLIVHKNITGRKLDYGIQVKPTPKTYKGISKGLFPALMAVNMSLMIAFNPVLIDIIVHEEYLTRHLGTELGFAVVFFVSLIVTTCIAMAIFSPVWFLQSAGIIFTNKEKVKDTIDPLEVRSVGGTFFNLLKGYAGIGVIIAYIGFFIQIIVLLEGDIGGVISVSLLIPLMPIIISVLCIPAFILLDMTTEHRKKFILDFAKKIGITEFYEIDIRKVSNIE